MNLSAPHLVALSKNEGAVLKVLARTSTPLSGREVARIGGGARSTYARALKRLVEHGLVEAREAGSGVVTLYTLNKDHLAARPVLELLNLRQTFIERLKETVCMWKVQPDHASLFGSVARGDGNTKSDIDMFLVRPGGVDAEAPSWRSQISDLQEKILQWTGNHTGIVEVSWEELERLRQERPHVVNAITRDGIDLAGPSVSDIFRGGSS